MNNLTFMKLLIYYLADITKIKFRYQFQIISNYKLPNRNVCRQITKQIIDDVAICSRRTVYLVKNYRLPSTTNNYVLIHKLTCVYFILYMHNLA